MASNRKKVMVPHTMGKEGVELLQRRDDIEVVIYPARHQRRPNCCRCCRMWPASHCRGTPYRQARDGCIAGDGGGGAHRRRLRRGGGAGADRAPRAADGRGHREFDVGRGACVPPDDGAGQTQHRAGCAGAQGHLGRSPWRPADGAVRQDGADRRLRPHRHTLGAALPGLRHERADLRSVRAGGEDHRPPAANASPISMPRCRARISCRSTARRTPRPSACSTPRGSPA